MRLPLRWWGSELEPIGAKTRRMERAMSWSGFSWLDSLGYAASLTVFATFCMSTMMPLRYIAIASNILFASYGYIGTIYPVLILHTVLLPVNITRLVQIRRLVRDINKARGADQTMNSLIPFMRLKRKSAGFSPLRIRPV